MPSNTYDLIVLGDDLGGLIAATLVARHGLRVLVVSSGRRESYQLGSYELPARALPFVGRGSPAVKRVVDELHFSHAINRRLGTSIPAYQLATPSARLDVYSDDETMLRGLRRETRIPEALAEAADGAARLSDSLGNVLGAEVALPPSSFSERRAIGRAGDQLRGVDEVWQALAADPIGRALLRAPTALSCRSLVDESDDGGHMAELRSFDLWRRGAPRLRGDWKTVREIFLEKLDNHGGDVVVGTPAELTFGWGGKVTGVNLADGDELGAGHVIVAMPIAELEALCGKHAKKLRSAGESVDLAGYRYVLNLILDEGGVPEGMGHTVIWVGDPQAEMSGANALLLHLSEPDSEAQVAVTVSALCRIRSDRTVGQSFADLRVEVRETLEALMPFSTDYVRLAHSPNERLPAEGPAGEYQLDEPIEPEPVWRYRGERHLGVSGLPYQLGLKNLTFASTQVLPGLGLEADFAVGWQAAKLALAGSGKKKELFGASALAAGD